MLFVAFSGMAFKTETEATLRPGESVTLKSPYGWTYTFTHLGVSQYDALNRQVTAATVEVRRDGRKIGLLSPEKRQHVDAFNRPTFDPSTEPSIMSMLREDLYGVLGGVVNGTEQAVFRFTINPLGHTFTLSFMGATTAPIPINSLTLAQNIRNALNGAFATIGTVGGIVTRAEHLPAAAVAGSRHGVGTA